MIEVSVSFAKGEAWVKYDDEKVTVAKLREAINSTGFQAVEEKRSGSGEAFLLRERKETMNRDRELKPLSRKKKRHGQEV